jgi:hypothetical protein
LAVNLWKLLGKPTSYNPLTLGFSNKVYANSAEYVLTFKAYSPSGAKLRIAGDNNNFKVDGAYQKMIVLTNLSKHYQVDISTILSPQSILFHDNDNIGDIIIEDIQLIRKPLGNPKRVSTTKRTNKQSKTGLSFNGTSDYLQLPSMTMDSVEIECLIDTVQTQSSYYLVDARTNLPLGYAVTDNAGGIGDSWTEFKVDGVSAERKFSSIPQGRRVKVRLGASVSFTDDVTILASRAGTFRAKAVLYKVTCYLAGKAVAEYDFENGQNMVGNQVLQNAKNLIPSFEDSGWNIHPNAKVLGKDVLHLDATGINFSYFRDIPLLPNTNYLLMGMFGLSLNHRLRVVDSMLNTNLQTVANDTPLGRVFNSGNTTKAYIQLENFGGVTGSFDFIRPQLYQLSGKEGTLYGSPIQQSKAPKRTLYAKR